MTLTVYKDMLQHSDEWFAARLGIVTASVVGQLITPKTVKVASSDISRGLYRLLLSERITGRVEETYQSPAMWRGEMDEPIARDLYSKRNAEVTECGFMVQRTDDGWQLGYSPDGLVGDDGLIEIKSREPKVQVATILADEVPPANMAQLQAGLLVSGRQWIDYVSFCGGLPLYVKRVFPDSRWNDAIVEAVAEFEKWAPSAMQQWADVTRDLMPTERVEYEMEMVI